MARPVTHNKRFPRNLLESGLDQYENHGLATFGPVAVASLEEKAVLARTVPEKANVKAEKATGITRARDLCEALGVEVVTTGGARIAPLSR